MKTGIGVYLVLSLFSTTSWALGDFGFHHLKNIMDERAREDAVFDMPFLDPECPGCDLMHDVMMINPQGNSDPRQLVPLEQQRQYPYSAVGKVYPAHGGMGTGFMVSQCLMVTNNHVCFGKYTSLRGRANRVTPSTNVELLFVFDNRGEQVQIADARPVDWGDYRGPAENGSVSEDWCLVRVSPCLGSDARWRYIDVDDSVGLRGRLEVVGYAHNRSGNMVRQSSCTASPSGHWLGGYTTSCSFSGGQSGGPVLSCSSDRSNCSSIALNTKDGTVNDPWNFDGETEIIHPRSQHYRTDSRNRLTPMGPVIEALRQHRGRYAASF